MKKCLLKFPWVKVPREEIPAPKGLLGYWLKLVSRAAFRKGTSTYCSYENAVEPGMWVGGIVGLKSILDVRNREKALQIMEELQKLGYVTYFQMTLEKTIRQTEKLLKILQAVQTGYADKRMEAAMEKAVTAAKQAEEVALLTRALPAYTGHPRAKELTRDAIAEAIPIEIGFTNQGWFCLRMPILLPRKEKSSRSYIRDVLYPALEQFAVGRRFRYRNCMLIFRHVYDRNRPEWEYRDYDNIELNTEVDAIAMFFLVDDTPLECRHYYCSARGSIERTEVYIVPRNEFETWLTMENSIPDIGVCLKENAGNIP